MVVCTQKSAIRPSYELGESNGWRKTVNATTFVEEVNFCNKHGHMFWLDIKPALDSNFHE
jgi:hypothetical protein